MSTANGNALYYRVKPSNLELKFIREVILFADQENFDYDTTHPIRPKMSRLRKRYYEFGVLSSSTSGNVQWVFRRVFRNMGRESELYSKPMLFSDSLAGEEIFVSKKTLVFDMAEFVQTSKYFQKYHPVLD